MTEFDKHVPVPMFPVTRIRVERRINCEARFPAQYLRFYRPIMNSIFIAVLPILGYLLPVPLLIWGWAAWWQSRPHFGSPLWRYVAVFSSITLASVVGLSVLFVIISHVSGMPESGTRYSFAMKSSAWGIVASTVSLLLSLIGKGPVRLPTMARTISCPVTPSDR